MILLHYRFSAGIETLRNFIYDKCHYICFCKLTLQKWEEDTSVWIVVLLLRVFYNREKHSLFTKWHNYYNYHIFVFLYYLALRIHVSPECKQILDELSGFYFERRGSVTLKVSIVNQTNEIWIINYWQYLALTALNLKKMDSILTGKTFGVEWYTLFARMKRISSLVHIFKQGSHLI